MSNRPMYLGTWNLVCVPVEVWLDPSVDGALVELPNNRKAPGKSRCRMNICPGYRDELFCRLLHESMEVALAVLGSSYERFWEDYRSPAHRLFVFNHEVYSNACAAVTVFMLDVWPHVLKHGRRP